MVTLGECCSTFRISKVWVIYFCMCVGVWNRHRNVHRNFLCKWHKSFVRLSCFSRWSFVSVYEPALYFSLLDSFMLSAFCVHEHSIKRNAKKQRQGNSIQLNQGSLFDLLDSFMLSVFAVCMSTLKTKCKKNKGKGTQYNSTRVAIFIQK